MNQWHQSHLTKMGTHGFRAPEKKASVNLEAQFDPWIHLQACPQSIVGSVVNHRLSAMHAD